MRTPDEIGPFVPEVWDAERWRRGCHDLLDREARGVLISPREIRQAAKLRQVVDIIEASSAPGVIDGNLAYATDEVFMEITTVQRVPLRASLTKDGAPIRLVTDPHMADRKHPDE